MTGKGHFDRVTVLGAGAVGSFLGARLWRAAPVVLVARHDHAEAVRKRGLRLSGELDETVRLDAATEMPDPGERALVIVAVKARSLSGAARVLARRGRADTTVLCVQNGLDPDERLRAELAALGSRPLVLRALVSAGCDLVRPGEVAYWGGGVAFPDSGEARPLVRLFEEAGVPVSMVNDFAAEIWTKLAVNCVANPLAAVLGVPNREIIAPELRALRRALVEEVRSCARDAGVELEPNLAERIDAALAASGNRNSMLQDVVAGRPTEIGELNERVAGLARRAGRDAPASRTLARLVRFLAGR